jgi:hypothetical protein
MGAAGTGPALLALASVAALGVPFSRAPPKPENDEAVPGTDAALPGASHHALPGADHHRTPTGTGDYEPLPDPTATARCRPGPATAHRPIPITTARRPARATTNPCPASGLGAAEGVVSITKGADERVRDGVSG